MLLKKLDLKFNNNLLGFLVKDLESVITSRSKHWSFLRYFDRFICASHLSLTSEELICTCLFVIGLMMIERNDASFESFVTLILNASNPTVHSDWPLILVMVLTFCQAQSVTMSDPFWLKVIQLLQAEHYSDLALNSVELFNCFTGTVIACTKEFKPFSQYDFKEDLSIERDAILAHLDSFFTGEGAFTFKICKVNGDYKLGSELAPAVNEIEQLPTVVTESAPLPFVAKDNSKLEKDINDLQERLKELEASDLVTSPKSVEIDLNKARFVLDANALIGNDSVIQEQLTEHPERFLIPLIVLAEIEKLKENSERSNLATRAFEVLDPLMAADKLYIVNNYGRLVRQQEIKQQCWLLSLSIGNRINDDVIIDICRELSKSGSILLLTEDINMRLKAKTRQIESVSVKEFRRLFNR